MNRKFFPALLLALTVAAGGASAAALDRTAYTVASGTVEAASFTDVLAPFSGTLLSFDLQPGDRVAEGDPLFRMRTTILRAPVAGTVTAVFAEKGQDASAAMTRYGALAALEAEHDYLIQATTAGAYNKNKNKELHVGETLYFQYSSGSREEGFGQVTAVSGDSYTVEILSGSFNIRNTLSLYRKDNYEAQEKVGTGTVLRRDPIPVTGAGRIGAVFVQPGDEVAADAPLFELLSADADPDADAGILSPCGGVIASTAVQPGQQVWKGALLARIYGTGDLEVIAEVDEKDLKKIRMGDVCPILLDMDEDTVLQGKITEISALGTTRQNAAWFRVHLALENGSDVPLGASASVYLPK